MRIARPGRAAQWTREKIDSLSTIEVRQLRDNAARLHESEIAALCDEVLGARPRGSRGAKPAAKAPARTKAKARPPEKAA